MTTSYSDITPSMKNYAARNSSNPPNISRPPRPQKEEKPKTFKSGLRPSHSNASHIRSQTSNEFVRISDQIY
jgi:hypothetical protein